MTLQARKLSHALGAEIMGVDITSPLNKQTLSDLHRAFLDHHILLFRGRQLTQEQHIAFSRQFGELDISVERIEKRECVFPEIQFVMNEPTEGPEKSSRKRYSGDRWHSDRANTTRPAMASLLRAVRIPIIGGDTMFANMYLAYETLSDGMKELIGNLHGVHVPSNVRVLHSLIAHPIVRTHPEIGRQSLYIGERVRQFVGMTQEESKPIIEFLCAHAARPQFVYRHVWQKDDIVMWDNRCTNHYAVGDFDTAMQTRHMERTTVMGTPCGYEFDEAKS